MLHGKYVFGVSGPGGANIVERLGKKGERMFASGWRCLASSLTWAQAFLSASDVNTSVSSMSALGPVSCILAS